MGNVIIKTNIMELKNNQIFVFGSNEKGKHETGAAKQALKFGAIYGQGAGLQGKTYAIPTVKDKVKGMRLILTINQIEFYINQFIEFAKLNPDLIFLVTEIGCGLAGFTHKQIAPLFYRCKNISNIHLPHNFLKELNT